MGAPFNRPSGGYHRSGSFPDSSPRALRTGWHLLGFGNQDLRAWHDMIGPAAGSIDALFAFDAPEDEFVGFEDPEFGNIDVNGDEDVEENEFGWSYGTEYGELRTVEAGAAYWVHFAQDTIYGPVLEVILPSDIDAWPDPDAPGNTWNPGGEDTDFNDNGLLDYGYTIVDAWDAYGNPITNTQDTVAFRIPTGAAQPQIVTRRRIDVLNNGSGVLLFDVENSTPGLLVQPTSGRVPPGEIGAAIQLAVDLSQLPVGSTAGTLTIRGNGGAEIVSVQIDVPPISGDFEGSIVITEVSTKGFYLGRRPFALSLDAGGGGLLQSSKSIHYPIDVVLTGSSTGATFDIAGELVLLASDPSNPFGVWMRRVIRLRGGFSPSSDPSGVRLGIAGSYQEWIMGLGDDSIFVEGEFVAVPAGG